MDVACCTTVWIPPNCKHLIFPLQKCRSKSFPPLLFFFWREYIVDLGIMLKKATVLIYGYEKEEGEEICFVLNSFLGWGTVVMAWFLWNFSISLHFLILLFMQIGLMRIGASCFQRIMFCIFLVTLTTAQFYWIRILPILLSSPIKPFRCVSIWFRDPSIFDALCES